MQRAARRIVEKLRLRGHEAFFAGGWVRDFLLRRRARDIDIATSARPEEVLRIFPRAHAVGAQFGVVQVRFYGHVYDIATFRTEGPYLDGRHPASVDFAGPKPDALRRDFTINGLFFDPVAERIIDYVGGAADIRKRILRTIGKPEERFLEDKLRMLRAIRLACELDFRIATDTMAAMRRLAPLILQVSQERIRDELLKMLTGPAAAQALDLLQTTGLLAAVLPEVEAMRGVEQPAEFHPEGDVYVHTRSVLALLKDPSPVLALATLLHDVGKPPTRKADERVHFIGHEEVGARMAEDICRRLRLPNEDAQAVTELVREHLRFIHIREMRAGTLRKFLSRPRLAEHLELHRVDCLSSGRSLEQYDFALEKLRELQAVPARERLVSGDDLIAMGYPPGPLFRTILDAVDDLQAERPDLTREQALEEVRRAFPLPPIV